MLPFSNRLAKYSLFKCNSPAITVIVGIIAEDQQQIIEGVEVVIFIDANILFIRSDHDRFHTFSYGVIIYF